MTAVSQPRWALFIAGDPTPIINDPNAYSMTVNGTAVQSLSSTYTSPWLYLSPATTPVPSGTTASVTFDATFAAGDLAVLNGNTYTVTT